MAIWITRPLDDANRLAEALNKAGVEPFVWPLLDVDFPCPDLGQLPDDVQALIVTSRNGIRGAAETSFPTGWLEIPVFVVGDGTATLARGFGFRDVRQGEGRAEALVPVIADAGLDRSSPLVHLRGDAVAFDMKAALESLGFELFEAETYRVVETQRLSARVIEPLCSGRVTGVVLMSPRTARCYCRVMKAAGLGDVMMGLCHYCISEAAAAPLEGMMDERSGGAVIIADEPSQSGILAALKKDA